MSAAAAAPPAMAALVVFGGGAALPWQRLLKPGFRHCFVCLNDGRRWIVVEPLSCFTEVAVLDVPADFDLGRWFAGHGLTAVPAPVRRVRRPVGWGPFTCVEAVKRVLGLRAPWVFTPWQLYRRLRAGAGAGALPGQD